MPSDWSSSGFLTFEMKSSTTQRFGLNLYDASGVRSLEILPFQGVWVRASIPLIHFQKMNTEGMDQASIWKTPRPGYWIGFTGAVGTISNIDSLGIAMNLPIGSPSLEIRNIRLTMNAEDTIFTARPLVDDFGQWLPDEWPGKIFTIDDLKKDWSNEEKSLQSSDPDISRYGGYKAAISKATGFFHVENIDGKWWFVDPDGYLFFSNGSCCIEPGTNLARIKGREYLFSSLPPSAGKDDNGNPENSRQHFIFLYMEPFQTVWLRLASEMDRPYRSPYEQLGNKYNRKLVGSEAGGKPAESLCCYTRRMGN